MQQNKHEFLPRERCSLWGMKFSARRRKVKLGHFYCQERRGGGGFNSLNFNWIEIIFSLPLTARTLLSIVKKGKYFSLKYIVPSIFYCYRNKSIWSWSKFLQSSVLSSPGLHMKSHWPRPSLLEDPRPGGLCLSVKLVTCLFTGCSVMDQLGQ